MMRNQSKFGGVKKMDNVIESREKPTRKESISHDFKFQVAVATRKTKAESCV